MAKKQNRKRRKKGLRPFPGSRSSGGFRKILSRFHQGTLLWELFCLFLFFCCLDADLSVSVFAVLMMPIPLLRPLIARRFSHKAGSFWMRTYMEEYRYPRSLKDPPVIPRRTGTPVQEKLLLGLLTLLTIFLVVVLLFFLFCAASGLADDVTILLYDHRMPGTVTESEFLGEKSPSVPYNRYSSIYEDIYYKITFDHPAAGKDSHQYAAQEISAPRKLKGSRQLVAFNEDGRVETFNLSRLILKNICLALLILAAALVLIRGNRLLYPLYYRFERFSLWLGEYGPSIRK